MTGVWKNYLFVIMAAIGYSATAIFVKLSYIGGMQPLPLISMRFFFAAWLMFFYLFITNSIKLAEIPRSILQLGLPGFLGYGGAVIGFLLSLKYLSAPIAAILLYTYPIHVTLLSRIFFNEQFTIKRIIALLFAFSGILCVINIFDLKDLALSPIGVMYSLLAAVGYAFFNVYGQKNISQVTPVLLSFYPLALGAIILPLFANPLYFIYTPHSTANFFFGLGLAILCTVVPMILYFKGMEQVKASIASVIASFEPVFTVILAAMILGDSITNMQLIGGFLILVAVLVLQTEGR